jgi:hypothetical protein
MRVTSVNESVFKALCDAFLVDVKANPQQSQLQYDQWTHYLNRMIVSYVT